MLLIIAQVISVAPARINVKPYPIYLYCPAEPLITQNDPSPQTKWKICEAVLNL